MKESAYDQFIKQSDLHPAEADLIHLASSIRAKDMLDEFVNKILDNAQYIKQGSKSYFSWQDIMDIKQKMMNK
jgi:hypothetical protein